MSRFFKKKSKKSQNNTTHDWSSNSSSKINEEVDIPSAKGSPSSTPRPRLDDKNFQKHASSTWPRLPEIALTTSQDSHHIHPQSIPHSPDFSSSSHSASDTQESLARQSEHLLYNHDHHTASTDTGSDTEVNENFGDHFNDGDSVKTLSRLPSLTNDHHKTEIPLDDSAANTLVEAALDKEEAKDRHVTFQNHVAESAALVQRMLSVKMGHHHSPDALGTMMQNRHDNRAAEEVELQSPQHAVGGGSVLASLMKLEASRHNGETKKSKKQKKVIVFPVENG